tara:strand:+ start:1056 stop:1547 length:492 start_codon:yes stop_codon:yes gene_type:complete
MKYLFSIIFCLLFTGCTEKKQSIIKTDDELTSNIKLLFEKYVNNDFDVSQYYSDNLISRINNTEILGYENLTNGFKSHHEILYENINIKDVYVHTNYFADGEIWSNAWFTWTGKGKTTGEDYSNRGHFDYKWEDGKIVELLAYFSEYAEINEAEAYAEAQKSN